MNLLNRILGKKTLQPSSSNTTNLISEESPKEPSEKKVNLSEQEKNDLIDYFAKGEKEMNENVSAEFDPLLEDAARLVIQSQMGSTSLIQRRMKLGYNRAGRIMDNLEQIGIVGPNQGSAAREVRIKTEAELEKLIQNGFKFFNTDVNSFYEENKIEIEKRRIEYQEQLKDQQLKSEKDQIRQELLEKERKKQLQRDVFKELLEEGLISNQFGDSEWNREPIPQDVKDKVWNRDSGRCVKCGSQENLEFDHIIPFSKGGATTYRNLQILCKKCNIEKSNKIG